MLIICVQPLTEVCRADAQGAAASAQPDPPSVLCRTSCPVSAATAVQPLTEVRRAVSYCAAASAQPLPPSVLCHT